MAVSEVSVANSALAKLGGERIISLDDSNSRAVVMKEQIYKVRDELLYSHPWNFALKRAQLGLLAEAPAFDFGYQFQLPNDCLRVVGTDIPKPGRWKVEGRVLVCDYPNVSALYISNSANYAHYSPGFVEAWATKLAADTCFSILHDASLKQLLNQEAEQKIRQARSFDAQESVGDRVYADSWIDTRY